MDVTLPSTAREAVAAHAMLPAGCVAVAMVSGGADSTAMLRLLAAGELADGLDLRVLHVNHLLRGEAADADAAFVEALCAKLGVPCTVARYDVGAYAAAEGLNLEDAGRRVRYRFAEELLDSRLAATGRAEQDGRIATAHTLDDRVETLLMRLASGSGAHGLASIRAVRDRIVRPLIDARHAEVVAYLTGLGQDWREDASNADTSRLRARVRHELLPTLEEMNPRFVETTARTLAILGDESALLEEMADGFVAGFASVCDGEVAFDRPLMRTLTRPMARRVVREALARAFPEISRLEFEHVEALVDGLAEDGFARDLPGGLRAFAEYARMVVCRTGEAIVPLEPSPLAVPGSVRLGGAGTLTATEVEVSDVGTRRATAGEGPIADEGRMVAVIDPDMLVGHLIADAPREGDRIRPLGMAGSRKVSDLLIDAKVPRRCRPLTPVVRDGDEIVWVAGVRMGDRYKVTAETTRAVRLEWTPDSEQHEGNA